MYAIKEETLSALGDTIRSKTLGTSELPVLNVENEYILYSNAFSYSLPGYVKKVKLTGVIDFSSLIGGNTASANGTQGLGVASGNFGRYDHRLVRQDDSYKVLFEGYGSRVEIPSKIIEFETIVEGNQWAFVVTVDSSSPSCFYLSFTAVGLDENGNEFKYTPLEMVDKINELEIIPPEAFNITGDCSYRFAYNSWNWLINQFGDKITTNNITNALNMFQNSSGLKSIPFILNINSYTLNGMFYYCDHLEEVPHINLNIPTGSRVNMNQLFQQCSRLREVENVFDGSQLDALADFKITATYSSHQLQSLFSGCFSLRKAPSWLAHINLNKASTYYPSNNYMLYKDLFYNCYSLDEIVNLPVISLDNNELTSNVFGSMNSSCYRIKNFIFETQENGTPYTATWSGQTIDLSYNIGYGSATYILNYNSGITADKEVNDDATYQALKNDPDWFATKLDYSRYNHDSAVNTINSLPDCSATGTNTIKFKGAAGTLTDGGAINTLTEEEIAVAAAKGWTVTLS
jgi:hypothetical protein